MTRDARGLEVSGAEAEVVAGIDDYVARLIRIEPGAERILEDARAHPDVPLVRLHAAAFFLFGQTDDSVAAATEHLAAVEPRLAAANERERAFHGALRLWHDGAYDRAAEAFEAFTERWPRDVAAAKMCEFLYYVLGQQHSGKRFRAHMARLEDANRDDPDYLAMAAFASELCDDFAGAEAKAARAIELAPRNPWAEHALAHVLIRQGRVDEGRRRMEAFLPELRKCGRIIVCHDVWHLALFHLEELDLEAATRLFREDVWIAGADSVSEQLDVIALLWRMEVAGGGVEDAWRDIAERILPHAHETFMPFVNAHFAYALGRAGRGDALVDMLARVATRSAQTDDESRRVWAPIGRPVIEACAAAGRGDVRRAASLLDRVIADMPAIGGSDAQCDLFRQLYLQSLRASGRREDARRFLETLTSHKHRRTPLDELLARGL